MKKMVLLLSLLTAGTNFCETEKTSISEFSFMLKPSPGKGIGVFATHDIPEGTVIDFFPEGSRRMQRRDVPEEFLKYCAAESTDIWLCPHDFGRMRIGWYLNHANSPNLKLVTLDTYVTTRLIQRGEEITMDYNELNEPEEEKDDYYRK